MGLKVTFQGGMPSIRCGCRTLFPQISKSQSSWPKFYLKAVVCSQGSSSRAPLFSDLNLPLMGTDIVQATRTRMLPTRTRMLPARTRMQPNNSKESNVLMALLEQEPNDVGRGLTTCLMNGWSWWHRMLWEAWAANSYQFRLPLHLGPSHTMFQIWCKLSSSPLDYPGLSCNYSPYSTGISCEKPWFPRFSPEICQSPAGIPTPPRLGQKDPKEPTAWAIKADTGRSALGFCGASNI